MGGDLTSYPFHSIQAALNSLPATINHTALINVEGTPKAGFKVRGFNGSGSLTVRGSGPNAVLTTGPASGTPGSGTSTTSVVQPTGATNWTASDLLGRLVKFTLSTGAIHFRTIKANTTTAFTVDTVSGLDTAATFQIFEPKSEISEYSSTDLQAIELSNNTVDVTLQALTFASTASDGLVTSARNANATVDGCKLHRNTVNPSVWSAVDSSFTLSNNTLSSSADVLIDTFLKASVTNNYCSGAGTITVQNGMRAVTTRLKSTGSATNVLKLINIMSADAETSASSGTATPVYLESCQQFTAIGADLLSGGSNTGGSTYGVQIEKAGRYTLTGSTLTGAAGDVRFMGNAVTWANLSSGSYGIASEHAGSATANSSYVMSITYGQRIFMERIDFSARVLSYGYFNWAQATGITATGTVRTDAVQLGAEMYNRIDTVAAGTGVRLPAGAALPGVFCVIHNTGANTLTIYPSDGAATIDGAASITCLSGARRLLISRDATSWVTLV